MDRTNRTKRIPGRGGFALISTLLVVVLVTVIAISFLAAIGTERVIAGAYGNMARARFSAEAAMESGLARMAALLEEHPGAVTMWEERGGLAATVLYFRKPEGAEEGEAGKGAMQVAPLLSGVEESTAKKWRGGEPEFRLAYESKAFAHPSNSVDINLPRYIAEPSGWIGSPAGEKRREIRVPWVELRTPEGVLTGRYAYWIEDESFKVPFNHVRNDERGVATPGIGPEEIPAQGVLAEVAARLGSNDAVDEVAQRIVTLRDAMPGGRLRDWNALNALPAFSGSDGGGVPLLGEQLRYYGTLFSESADLTSEGARRLNLNALFVPETEGGAIRLQVDRAVAAIRRHLPDFGERFYRVAAGSVPEAHQTLYLEKLAVNIRDAMMPPDLPPTVIWEEGAEPPSGRPVRGIEPMAGDNWPGVNGELQGGTNGARAIGKKNLPYLHEWACHVRLLKFDETKGSHADFEFMTHFYLEFWNMTSVDIDTGRGDLGEHPFIRLYNLPTFDIGSEPLGWPEDAVEIPLENVVFKAGRATVITTALPEELNTALLRDTPVNNVIPIAIPEKARSFSGKTTSIIKSGRARINLLARSSSMTDYETFLILGNDAGLLDSVPGLALARGEGSGSNALSLHNDDRVDPQLDTVDGPNVEQYYVRGGSLRGNANLEARFKSVQTGDPRSINEQLFLRLYEKGRDEEQTRQYNSGLDNPSKDGDFYVPASSSLGRQNIEYVDPTSWPDPFAWSSGGIDSPAWYPAGPLRSIGELGHVYDPARIAGPTGNIFYSRGGGRTLAIGQPDPLGSGTDGSDEREAWRLTDLFSTAGDLLQPGRININGLLRDDGVAFRALFSGFRYEEGPGGDPGLAGKALASKRLEEIVSAMQKHLEKHGPYTERGAWSEALGAESGATYDRGREELFRRSVELTTTRGSLFTLYAMGEAVRQTPSGALVRGAVSRLKVTFKVVPVWNEALDDHFDPADADAVVARFRPPDRYAVEIVQVE